MKICKTSKDPDNIVLLRRPRPPKKTINLRSDQNPITNSFATISSEGDFYSPITARKNCLDGTGEMKHLKSDPRRKQGDFVIHPLYPRGPEFFPPGSALHASTAPTISQLLDQVLPNEIHLPCTTKEKDQFMLNSFLIPVKIRPPVKIYPGSISHQNYQKLTSWFSRHFPRQDKLNQAKLEVGLQPPPSRVPKQQVLLELQSMMKKLLKKTHADDGSKPLSSPITSPRLPQWPSPSPQDVLFRSCTSQFFCGQGRSQSPFDAQHQPFISPSEVAVLESMQGGGQHLSFKAHFIAELPLLSPLVHTLTYLNLSFNSLEIFPQELFELHLLIFLSMRNNPIRSIPNGIRKLRNLSLLCLSFCILSDLPDGLYDLQNVVDLDVSYNNLSSLSRDIHKLRNLRKLNVEGNQLPGLPSTMLSLSPSHIILGNNLMQHIFWKHNISNQPQALTHMCSVVVSRSVASSEALQLGPFAPLAGILERSWKGCCDSCGDAVFGPGLSVIRGVEHSHFRVRNLPFIFTVCSPECRTTLRKRPDSYWLDKYAGP